MKKTNNYKEVIFIELIFAYPSATQNDIAIYKEKRDTFDLYYLSIEGYIFHETLQDGINYLEHLKNKFKEEIFTDKEINTQIKNNSKKIMYKNYNIEIVYDDFEKDIMIFLYPPIFINLLETYIWLDGAIEQLKTIEV